MRRFNILFFFSLDTCHFQKLMEENAAPTEFDFNWNSVPIAVGATISDKFCMNIYIKYSVIICTYTHIHIYNLSLFK